MENVTNASTEVSARPPVFESSEPSPLVLEELRSALESFRNASDSPGVPNDATARLEALARLACEADEPEHARTLLAPKARGLVHIDERSGLPAAFILWGPVTEETRAWLAPQGLAADFEVLLIAVEAARRRRGIGRELLEAALESEAKGARWVLGTGNVPATERFYRASAWEPVGFEAGYFERAYGHAIFDGETRLTARAYFMKTTKRT